MNVELNVATIVSMLGACAKLGRLELGNAVMDICMKGESVEDARQVFDEMHQVLIVADGSMNTLMEAKSNRMYRDGAECNKWTWTRIQEALKQFAELIESGTRSNEVIFLAIFTACCHSGLVDEGCRLFNPMTDEEERNNQGSRF
ncbi:hypothetical protein AHAS_Ahas01G0067500 [Arachis hypogaea]